jgi:heme-degrading monooxygenase HmoA
MIARTWWGATRAEDADAYLAYMAATGFRAYRETPGNRGVRVLRRTSDGPAGARAEFLVVSFWESPADVRRFAGDDVERAVFYPEDERFLVARDDHVTHYEVVFADGGAA